MLGREIFTKRRASSTPPECNIPETCPSPTTLLTYPWDAGFTTSAASQFDTQGGGFGDFAQSYSKFSFTLGALITGVKWTMTIGPLGEAHVATFKVAFMADNAGVPGTQLQTQTFTQIQANETLLGTSGTTAAFSYSATLTTPFISDCATTFWLFVQANGVFPPQYGWSKSATASGVSYQVFFGTPADPGIRLAYDLLGCMGS
jgi:hypothetical protein